METVSDILIEDTAVAVRSPSRVLRVGRASVSEQAEPPVDESTRWIGEFAPPATADDAWRQFLGDLALSGVSLANGEVVAGHREDDSGVLYRHAPGSMLDRLALPRDCHRPALAPYGHHLLLTCIRHEGTSVEQFTLGDAHRWESLRSLRSGSHDLIAPPIVSSAGPGMILRGACEPTAGLRAGGQPICWFNGHRWATRWLRRSDEPWPLALVGSLLAHVSFAAGVNIVDLETQGIDVPADGEPVAVAHGMRLDEVVAIDGVRVAGVARAEDGSDRRVLYFGRMGTRLREYALPEGARDAAFADATHAIAAGDTFDQVWVSHDGAVTWERAAYPVDGSTGGLSLASAGRGAPMPWVECSPSYCRAGDRVVWLPRELAERLRSNVRVLGPSVARSVERSGE